MPSQRYPTHSLPDTLERLQRFYDSEGINPADRVVIAQAIGYTSRNGASDAFISAMAHYGLIEDTDNQMARISEIGIDILEGDATTRATAIEKAERNPELFSELS